MCDKDPKRVKLIDDQVKVVLKLANYGICEYGNCHCNSWRSSWHRLETLKTREELLRALHQPCLKCHHDVKSHISKFLLTSANLRLEITENDVFLHITRSSQKFSHKDHVNFELFKLLRKSMMLASRMSGAHQFDQPPFESPTIHEALQIFLEMRFPDCDESHRQLMVNNAKIFCEMLNELKFRPTDNMKPYSNVDDVTFQLFYGRWLMWCYPDDSPGAPPRNDVTKSMGRTWLRMAYPIIVKQFQRNKSFGDKLPSAKGLPYLAGFTRFLKTLECDIYAKGSPIWKTRCRFDLDFEPVMAISKHSNDLLRRRDIIYSNVDEPVNKITRNNDGPTLSFNVPRPKEDEANKVEFEDYPVVYWTDIFSVFVVIASIVIFLLLCFFKV